MANGVLIHGRITRVVAGMDGATPTCTFRVGGVKCRATGTLAELIVSHQGYPLHNVRVDGPYHGSVLTVCSVTLVD